MRTSYFAKLGTLTVLGITAALGTWMLAARVRQSNAAQAFEGPSEITEVIAFTKRDNRRSPLIEAILAGDHSVGSGTVKKFDVETAGGVAHVKASAFVSDTRPNQMFIWALRVLDPEDLETFVKDQKSVLFEQLYPDKVFALTPKQKYDLEFDELVTLPLDPGKYVLELTWFRFDANLGVDSLLDPSTRNLQQGAMGRADIVLE